MHQALCLMPLYYFWGDFTDLQSSCALGMINRERERPTSLFDIIFFTELCCLCTAFMNCTLFCTHVLYGYFIPRLL